MQGPKSEQTSVSIHSSRRVKLGKGNSVDLSSTTSQVGALAWSKSAAGGRMRHSIASRPQGTVDPLGQWSTFLGYLGPSTPQISPSLFSSSQHSQPDLRGHCFKLHKDKKFDQYETTQRALLFLKLREDGCSKQKSLVFAQKRKCRFDTTQTWDGPSCHRTIAVGDNHNDGPNWSGWQLHSPKLLVGLRYQPVQYGDTVPEYDMIAKEVEDISSGEDKECRAIDKRREQYFADLSREWEKRQAKKSHRQTVSLHIPEESSPVPLEMKLSVSKPIETETASTETKSSVRKPHSRLLTLPSCLPFRSQHTLHLKASPIYHSFTQRFPHGYVTFRSVQPEGSGKKRKFPRRRSEFTSE